ncbi:hypothetical protein GCM10023205_73130 [Yinghuangia aomiensis]|uniref:PAS fold-4 domain-containing protein n=1 Tax=Yinghuangia aomiensis TaxID=676205 RepID=A0ABP9I7H2_9ACTN
MNGQNRVVAGLGLPPEWAEALAAAVFSQESIGLVVFDADLRVIAANTTAELFQHTSVRSGDSAETVFTTFGLEAAIPLLRQALAADTPIIGRQPFAAREPNGGLLLLRVALFRVPPRGGTALGLLVTLNDVTEEAHAATRSALLHEASTAIGASLNVTKTAQQLADLVLP